MTSLLRKVSSSGRGGFLAGDRDKDKDGKEGAREGTSNLGLQQLQPQPRPGAEVIAAAESAERAAHVRTTSRTFAEFKAFVEMQQTTTSPQAPALLSPAASAPASASTSTSTSTTTTTSSLAARRAAAGATNLDAFRPQPIVTATAPSTTSPTKLTNSFRTNEVHSPGLANLAQYRVGGGTEEPKTPLSAGGGASGGGMLKANSTSSIFVRSLVLKPNCSEVLSAMATVLHAIMMQRHAGDVAPPVESDVAILDERTFVPKEARKLLRWQRLVSVLSPGSNSTLVRKSSNLRASSQRSSDPSTSSASGSVVPPPHQHQDDATTNVEEGVPPRDVVHRFLEMVQRRADFTAETMVVALILLNRLLTLQLQKRPAKGSGLFVHAYNWRLLFLTSLLVAQKTIDDVALDNKSFVVIWKYAVPGVETKLDTLAFNQMELKFLALMDYSLYISRSLYASFCFELRGVFEAETKDAIFPLEPLSPAGAAKLETNSSVSPDVLKAAASMQRSYTCFDVASDGTATWPTQLGSVGRAVVSG